MSPVPQTWWLQSPWHMNILEFNFSISLCKSLRKLNIFLFVWKTQQSNFPPLLCSSYCFQLNAALFTQPVIHIKPTKLWSYASSCWDGGSKHQWWWLSSGTHAKTFQQSHKVKYDAVCTINTAVTQPLFFILRQTSCTPYDTIYTTAPDV